MKKNNLVRVKLQSWGDPEDQTLDEIIFELTDLKKVYGAAYKEIRIEKERDQWSDGFYWVIAGYRAESETEERDRLAKEKNNEDANREKRRLAYEKLKKEFGAG
jgi:hypothetical protein